MKLHVVLLLTVFCFAFPVYAPETQDRAAGESQDAIENLTTVIARQQALTARLESARSARQANDPVNTSKHLTQAGHLRLKLHLTDEALTTFQESLTLAEKAGDPRATVDALNGLSSAYLQKDKYDEAMNRAQRAVAISEQSQYDEGRANGLLNVSECQNNEKHTDAVKTAQEALQLWQALSHNRGIVRTHLLIATYQVAMNSLDEATRSSEVALDLSRNHRFMDLEADALISLGFIEYRRGIWQDVINFLRTAEKLVDEEAEPFKRAQIVNGLAEAYMESGLPESGLAYYEKGLEYAKKTNRPRDVIVTRWGVARALYLSQNYERALEELEASLIGLQSLDLPIVVAMCNDFLGRTHDGLNHPDSALQYLKTALEMYSKADNTMEVARTRARIGQIYEKKKQIAEARSSYQQAMQTFDALSDRVNQSATLFALGRLEMQSGNYELAESHLQKSIEVTENMRRMSTSRDLTAAFSATVHDRYEQYIECLMRNHRDPGSMSRVVAAFETSESARARSLAELLRVSDTNLLSSVDPELSKQERTLRKSLRVKEDARVSLLRRKPEKQELDKLDAELEQLNTEYKNILDTINQRYPAFGQLTQPHSWDLQRIQKEVIGDDDTLLLEYLLGPEKSYVWVVTRSGFTSHELPSQTAINDAVKKVYDLLRVKPKDETKNNLDQATKELAQMILWPVADQLQKQRIIVAADGALNYIPFQILPAAENAEDLVSQREIINVPSASILGELRKEASRRGVREKVLAAIGNPVFAEQGNNEQVASTRNIVINGDSEEPASMGTLFFAGREIANLRDVASEAKTFAATEREATRDQLLSLDLSRFAILHFATHGVLRPSNPENSGLYLSTINRDGQKVEGFVGLQDIYSLRAPVDLVVLSACQTGLGKDIRGEGLIGLTRGFMYAGATSVVASLWKVEDEATAELMKIFYTEMLKNGKTPAEALRLAQNSIRRDPRWSAPHYWAGFTLQGEYRYVVNSSRGWQVYQIVLLSAIGVFALSIGLFLFLRQRNRQSAKRTSA